MAISNAAIAKAFKEGGKRHMGGGVFLDVRSASSASWFFKFTCPGGKGDAVGLGSHKKLASLPGDVGDEIERLRLWCVAELAAGNNPRETRANEKLEKVRAVNAPKGATVYETAKANVHLIAKYLRPEGRAAWVRSLHSDFIGAVADMEPAKVTDEHVITLIKRLYEEKPVQAEDVRQRLAKVLNRACRKIPGWVNPARWDGHLEEEVNTRDRTPKHHAALPAFRVGKFIADLRAKETSGLPMRSALEWHVISATRPGEAAATDWAWFDWANDCVVYPAEIMKMRRPHRVPLTARHHAILDAILAGADAPASGPVFTFGADPVSVPGMRKAMQFVAKGCTLHGFRSSFATWARGETYPVQLPTGELRRVRLYDEAQIEECLAHVVGGEVRNAYVRDDFLELRRPMLQAWADYCATVIVQSDVTPMRRRAIPVQAVA